jgi:hypothetical protein
VRPGGRPLTMDDVQTSEMSRFLSTGRVILIALLVLKPNDIGIAAATRVLPATLGSCRGARARQGQGLDARP